MTNAANTNEMTTDELRAQINRLLALREQRPEMFGRAARAEMAALRDEYWARGFEPAPESLTDEALFTEVARLEATRFTAAGISWIDDARLDALYDEVESRGHEIVPSQPASGNAVCDW